MFSPRCMYNIGLSHDFQMTLTFRAKFYTCIPSKMNTDYILWQLQLIVNILFRQFGPKKYNLNLKVAIFFTPVNFLVRLLKVS